MDGSGLSEIPVIEKQCIHENEKKKGKNQCNCPTIKEGNVEIISESDSLIFFSTNLGGYYYLNKISQETFSFRLPESKFNLNYNCIILKDKIISATEKGLFYYNPENKKWVSLNADTTVFCTDNTVRYFNVDLLTSSQNNILIVTKKGFFVSTNSGETWNRINLGIKEYSMYTFKIQVIDNYIFAYTYDGLLISTDSGLNWHNANNVGICTKISTLVTHNNKIYAGPNQDKMYVSDDKGNSWQELKTGRKKNMFYDYDDGIRKLTKNGNNLFYSFNGELCNSTDNGLNWNLLLNNGVNDYFIKDSLIYYVNSYSGSNYLECKLYESSDKGKSWNSIFKINQYRCYSISLFKGENNFLIGSTDGLFVVTKNKQLKKIKNICTTEIYYFISLDSLIFAGTWDGVFVSKDDGLSWNKSSKGLPISDNTYHSDNGINYFDMSVYYFIRYNKNLIAITQDGLYLSKDFGNTWTSFNEGLEFAKKTGSVALDNRALTIDDEFIYFGSNGSGIFKRKLSDIE